MECTVSYIGIQDSTERIGLKNLIDMLQFVKASLVSSRGLYNCDQA